MNPQVSIIIVNFNSERYLGPCLDSVMKHTKGVAYEIIVVDNASDPDSVNFIRQNYPEVRLIRNDKNLGFGAANNRGASEAGGEYLFFLNPDTQLTDNALLKFSEFLKQNSGAAACGGNLVDDCGQETTAYGHFPSVMQEWGDTGFRRYFPKYYNNKLAIGKTCESVQEIIQVPYLVGADIFIRKDAFQEVSGFDKHFFLYYEETDLFFRLYKKNFKTYLLPDVRIIHHEGEALMSNGELNLKKWAIWEQSKYYYFKKNKGIITALLVKKIQLISLLLHYFFGRTKYPLMKTLGLTWKA